MRADAERAGAARAGLAVHGGDLDGIARRYGVARETLVDFSANLNPLGPPPALLDELAAAAADVADLGRYPEPDGASLRTALGAHLAIDPDAIVVGNGAAALICVAAAVALHARCLVPIPSFSEDAHALAAARIALVALPLDAREEFALPLERVTRALETGDVDGALVTSPHNPTGALVPPDDLGAIVDAARTGGGVALLDEAFVDFTAGPSLVARAAYDGHAIAIRSLTKFFAVPALRVGYAVARPDLARRMRAALPSWPVTTLASRALVAALRDAEYRAYAEATLATVATERAYLARELGALPLRVFPSAANFLLCELRDDLASVARLVRDLIVGDGLVLRDCSSYAGLAPDRFFRVAVRARADNARLLAALRSALAG